MAFLNDAYHRIHEELSAQGITLVAVSKTKPNDDIMAAYEAGQRDFGENYVQELTTKQASLPADIRWHFIGHLQRNKVKYIAPFVHLIHGVDSESLLAEIHKQGLKNSRVIPCLLQVYIAGEETKFGLSDDELDELMQKLEQTPAKYSYARVCGLMGMASFTDDQQKIRQEFEHLRSLFDKYRVKPFLSESFKTLSMGMSSDFRTAAECGSNMVRIGSLIFGERNYSI